MNDYNEHFLVQMQKEIDELTLTIRGAAHMLSAETPHHEFLMYVRKVLFAMYDDIALHRINLSGIKSVEKNNE